MEFQSYLVSCSLSLSPPPSLSHFQSIIDYSSEFSALIIDFKVLENPLAPGSDISSRVIYLDETLPPSATISLDIISGVPIGPLPFRVLPLTYDEYEARFPSMSLDNLFPRRPIDPAGGTQVVIILSYIAITRWLLFCRF